MGHRESHHKVSYEGKILTLVQAARAARISYSTLSGRVYSLGHNAQEAFDALLARKMAYDLEHPAELGQKLHKLPLAPYVKYGHDKPQK